MPVFQNAVYPTAEIARASPTGDLAFDNCAACGFISNSAFEPLRINYSAGYDNSQVHSKAFLEHLSTRIERILAALPREGRATVVEIGCGQGDFLGRVRAAVPASLDFRAVGFDPAYGGGANMPTGVEIHPVYFDRESVKRLDLAPDVVVSRHTIEHVSEPVEFLGAIRSAMDPSKKARLFIETPDNAWILKHDALHDFFYEHCSLFDFRSMTTALVRSRWQPSLIETCFDGQYLWVEAEPAHSEDAVDYFTGRSAAHLQCWRSMLEQAKATGGVALWGAGAKGATFALMMDPAGELIDVLVDSNPGKAGAFVAVTAHPIIAPEALRDVGVETIIVMNPNYEREIRDKLAQLGLSPAVMVVR